MPVDSQIGITISERLAKQNPFPDRGVDTLNPVVFSINGKEVLRLEDTGMYYMGRLVKNSADAHARFLEWVKLATDGLI